MAFVVELRSRIPTLGIAHILHFFLPARKIPFFFYLAVVKGLGVIFLQPAGH